MIFPGSVLGIFMSEDDLEVRAWRLVALWWIVAAAGNAALISGITLMEINTQ
jgi:hypothetical protein